MRFSHIQLNYQFDQIDYFIFCIYRTILAKTVQLKLFLMNALTIAILTLTFTFFQQPAETNIKKVPSTIEEATVYLRGAQVTRNAEVELQAGSNTITFSDLSIQFSEASIQIASDKQITILSLRKSQSRDGMSSQK